MSTSASPTTAGATRPVILPLYQLSCSSDVQTIERVLKREPGVVEVYANPATEKVYIQYEAALTNPDRLRAVLQEAGYGRRPQRVACGRCR
jgi:copper chaperone CopZ